MTRIAFSTRMRIVRTVADVRTALDEPRRKGLSTALVPTMGALHEGHLHLVDEALRVAGIVVMSIFVNPLQFGPQEDFERYPRNLETDAALAKGRGVDILFVPSDEEMYARDRCVYVTSQAIADRWEGQVRPGHFTGVLTVVAKLLNIVQPQVALFGQKDIQQATLVRAMVRDLDFPVTINVIPTVREFDGLALSSRNIYLSTADRHNAVLLPGALRSISVAFSRGVVDARALERLGREVIATSPAVRIDYLAVVDPLRLEPVDRAVPGSIVLVAARVGTTRILDNIILGAT